MDFLKAYESHHFRKANVFQIKIKKGSFLSIKWALMHLISLFQR